MRKSSGEEEFRDNTNGTIGDKQCDIESCSGVLIRYLQWVICVISTYRRKRMCVGLSWIRSGPAIESAYFVEWTTVFVL